jgi:hypothetical protein
MLDVESSQVRISCIIFSPSNTRSRVLGSAQSFAQAKGLLTCPHDDRHPCPSIAMAFEHIILVLDCG